MAKSVTRLFDQFKPENYQVELFPDRDTMTFKGTVTIRGKKSGRPSQRLTFHQRQLKVTSATLIKHDKTGDKHLSVDRINTHAKFTEVRLHAREMVYPGSYTVTMHFQGAITKAMNGMYPCFFEHDGKQKSLIATQFESHYAREVFPSIDEPEAKATFDLTLTTPAGETVLANTPIKSKKVAGKLQTTTFETTPRMSTYLLAFVYGEMHCESAKTKDGIEVRSWAAVARPKKDLRYSVDEAVRVLEFFTEYFGVAYPLEKCDQVALPDFDAGAMENWGLITYREIALLADPNNRSFSSEQYISLVIAHELSHQWFGNLVTMKWWDDLWLNESFASLMEFIALDAIHPDWQQWEAYTSSDVVATTSRDVYSDINPVGVKVTDPELIDTLFDPGIVYAKGGRLLKMLREYIGDQAFTKGLREYFKKHAYSNATREDLWAALSEASGKDISHLMTPWLTRPGMPVLHVSQTGKKLRIRQERFLLDKQADSSIWPVPLLPDRPFEPDILDSREINIALHDLQFRILNHHASGHFFVDYDEPKHRQYIDQLVEEGKLPTETKINMLNDIYMLSRRGDASLTEGLDVALSDIREKRDSVWELILRTLAACSQLTEGDKVTEGQLKMLRRNLGYYWYGELGWEHHKNDDANTRQLRHTAIALMTAGEDADALAEAKKRYQDAAGPDQIDAELRNTILGSCVRQNVPGVVEALTKLYPKAAPDLQLDITGALASTKDPMVAKTVLDQALGEDGFVRHQDALRWVALFLRNPYTRDAAWEYAEKSWVWIYRVIGTSKNFDFIPIYLASVLTTKEGLKKFDAFFDDKKDIKVLRHNISVGRADIRARIEWRERDEPQIKSWLETTLTDQ